jgi:hypothetical protein
MQVYDVLVLTVHRKLIRTSSEMTEAVTWRNSGRPREPSVDIAGVQAEIETYSPPPPLPFYGLTAEPTCSARRC